MNLICLADDVPNAFAVALLDALCQRRVHNLLALGGGRGWPDFSPGPMMQLPNPANTFLLLRHLGGLLEWRQPLAHVPERAQQILVQLEGSRLSVRALLGSMVGFVGLGPGTSLGHLHNLDWLLTARASARPAGGGGAGQGRDDGKKFTGRVAGWQQQLGQAQGRQQGQQEYNWMGHFEEEGKGGELGG
jgi:hypothetical protein